MSGLVIDVPYFYATSAGTAADERHAGEISENLFWNSAEEKEENSLEVHTCTIFDQCLLFTNYSPQKQRNYWSFIVVVTAVIAWQVWVKYFSWCYAPLTHPGPLDGESMCISRKASFLAVKFFALLQKENSLHLSFLHCLSPIVLHRKQQEVVLTACMGAVSLFVNWLCGKHLFSAQLHLFVHIHCFLWCSAEEKKENKPQQICHACWSSQSLSPRAQ